MHPFAKSMIFRESQFIVHFNVVFIIWWVPQKLSVTNLASKVIIAKTLKLWMHLMTDTL